MSDNSLMKASGHLMVLVGEMALPFVIIAWFAIFACSNDALVRTIRNDRMVQRIESAPVLWMPWGWYAGSRPIPEPEHQVAVMIDGKSDSFGSIAGLMQRFTGAKIGNAATFMSLLVPRLLVLVGLLPAFLALLSMAWFCGRVEYARRVKAAVRFSPRIYDWCQMWMWISFGLLVGATALPFPMSSWLYLLPMASSWAAMYFFAANRA